VVVDLTGMTERLGQGLRLIGLDLGEKTIGAALSDTLLTIASPLETLKRGKFKTDLATLSKLLARHGAGGLVIGLPLNMDGSEGPAPVSTSPFFFGTSACRRQR